MATCLECDGSVGIPADTKAGEIVECGECQVELEVLTVDPVTVVLAPEIEEDWGE
ncbi:lysine biosynthesis protein LysW [Streptomyces sp. NPDC058251]|uniref:lysine biosynthesis protein LysW n=1 Tax=unclassified Streptomyces TaxID=2593676 RepID=UPI0036566846